MKLDEIRSLAKIMQDADLTSLEVSEGGMRVKLEKKQQPVPTFDGGLPAPCTPSCGSEMQNQKNAEQFYREIKSPMVGVFYSASSPESEPYVKVGETVKKGDVVCIIEAMKLLNEINADQDGEVAEICAENGQVVEYGQTLFRLR